MIVPSHPDSRRSVCVSHCGLQMALKQWNTESQSIYRQQVPCFPPSSASFHVAPLPVSGCDAPPSLHHRAECVCAWVCQPHLQGAIVICGRRPWVMITYWSQRAPRWLRVVGLDAGSESLSSECCLLDRKKMLTVYLPRWKHGGEWSPTEGGVCQVHTSALGHETVTTMSVKLWGRGSITGPGNNCHALVTL